MKAWEEVGEEPLQFTIRGCTYTVPELPYQDWLMLQRARAGERTELDDADPLDTWRYVMGSAWDRMVADNVPAAAMSRAGLATMAFLEFGRDMAELVWEAGVDPKALAEDIAARATERKPPPSTGSENQTPSRASTTRTTSLKGSSKKKKDSRS